MPFPPDGASAPPPADPREAPATTDLSSWGTHLRSRFDELQAERYLAEQEWLKSLRQYLGEYDEEGGESEASVTNYYGSRAFIRLTRAKVRAMDARVNNIVFPGGADKNWKIEPTPKPEFPESLLNEVKMKAAAAKLLQLNTDLNALAPEEIAAMQQAGEFPDIKALSTELQAGTIPPALEPSLGELDKLIMDEARRRSDAMEAEIADQLEECDYAKEVKKSIHSGHLYGTGWLKGPIVEKRSRSTWNYVDGEWTLERVAEFAPAVEFNPIWDIYPDALDVSRLSQCEGIYQRYVMNRQEVRALKRREYFKADLIEDYLASHPKGDGEQLKTHENELRMIRVEDQGTLNYARLNRYDVLEWTGYADAATLEEAGVDLPPDTNATSEFRANVWVLGNNVICAKLTLYDDDTIELYHRYVPEESETGIYGIGIPAVMRDPQRMFNAAIRAMLDNMGLSSAPMFDVNVDLLTPDELLHLDEIVARRVWTRTGTGVEAQYPAVRPIVIPALTAQFMEIARLALDLSDEATSIPRYVTGNEKIQGAGQTASGLSMLFGQADIMLRECVSNFDDGITKSVLRAFYHWNMQFSKKQEIKGDFDVKATASTSLIAKDMHAQKLDLLAQTTLNPIDAPLTKRLELLRERVRARDMDPDKVVVTDEELQQQQAQEQAMAQQPGAMAPPGAPV
jgi:hypothetical protein